ncbi:MAG TPA: EAL domain-containing protein [Mycobacteriales bacterium]|nr:EAL domain-containing protein [Mycobacteriales bacterium]
MSAVLTASWTVGALLGWGGEEAAAWVSDLTLTSLAVLAAVVLARAAARHPVGRRLPFALLATGCGLWAVGEGTWSWYELVLHRDVPFPSPADVAYLAAAPVVAAGLLALARGIRQRSHRTRAALDGLLVAGSCLAVGWVVLLAPVAREAEGGMLAVAVAVAYPVTDLVLVTVAVLAARDGVAGRRRSLLLVAAAALAMAVADGAFTLLELTGRYSSGSVVDVGWVVGYLLFAQAGLASGAQGEEHDTDRPTSRVEVLAPYLVVLAAICVMTAAMVFSGSAGPVALVLLVLLVLALVGRQALTVLDNAALASLLALRERHFRSLVIGAKDIIVLCGPDIRTTYVSPSCEAVLGLPPAVLVGRPFWDLVHPDDVAEVREEFTRVLAGKAAEGPLLRCRITTADGWVDTESTIGDLRGDPGVAGVVITTRDVSERTALEAQLRALARHDPLTGLANRTLLHERLSHALRKRRPVSEPLGLLCLDLDGFKPVNDTYGHAIGDLVLQQVAERLLAGVRTGDTVSRLGGDEFAVLLEVRGDGGLRRGGLDVAERLLAALHEPFVVNGNEVSVGASMGLAIAGRGADADAMLQQADFAMYASKDHGRGRVTVFGPELAAVSSRRAELATSLRTALAGGGLHLHYQPVVDLATGTLLGAEALARWDHPQWGVVPPSEFVPVAEVTGLIVQLGHWALLTASRQAAEWEAAGRDLGVAVNVSVRQLGPEFVADVAGVLAQTALTPSRLTLEITESLLVDDERTLASLSALRELGVRLALDDFGTGWSSLAYLRRLPVDVLKLDGSFVKALGSVEADAVSRTVVRLAIDLGLEVVAEGVETVAQRDILHAMGCHSAQGWLYGHAGPAEALLTPHVAVPVSVPAPRRPARRADPSRSSM